MQPVGLFNERGDTWALLKTEIARLWFLSSGYLFGLLSVYEMTGYFWLVKSGGCFRFGDLLIGCEGYGDICIWGDLLIGCEG